MITRDKKKKKKEEEMKFGGVKILRNSRRNTEKGLKRKKFESENIAEKKTQWSSFCLVA